MLLQVLCSSALLLLAHSLTDDEIAAFNRYRHPNRLERNTRKKTYKMIKDNGDGTLTLKSNNIPNHDTWPFPNSFIQELPFEVPASIGENMHVVMLDKEPKFRAEPLYCMPYGSSGWSVSGASISSVYTAEKGCHDAHLAEAAINDICMGHPTPMLGGSYHYHAWSPCVTMEVCGVESPLFGVMMDGFPVYGPIDENGRQLTKQDLDECGGRFKDGHYRYHVTADYPYLPTCLKGEIRRDWQPTDQLWLCACPFSDQLLAPPVDVHKVKDLADFIANYSIVKTLGNPPTVPEDLLLCKFDGEGEYADCGHRYNTTYVNPTKIVQLRKEISLIPCCPPGEDCGESCLMEDENHVKSYNPKCFREKRTVVMSKTVKKTKREMMAEARKMYS